MPQSRKILILAVIALLIRLVIIWQWMEAADTANYHRVAITLAEGGRLYRDTPGIYPYPPVWALVESGSHWLSRQTPITFVTWVKLLPVLFDLAIAFLLVVIARAQDKPPLTLFALYAFNPAAVMITAMHGQFDALAVFFMLLACYWFDLAGRRWWSAASLMLGIALKSFPVLILPFFLIRLPDGRSRARYTAVALGPVGLLLLPFLVADAPALLRQLFGYQGVVDYGLLAIVEEAFRLFSGQPIPVAEDVVLLVGKLIFGLMYAGLLLAAWRSRARPDSLYSFRYAALVFLAFYLIYPGISSQYLLWLLPFAAILSIPSTLLYSAFATAALAAYYALNYPEILLNTTTRLAPPALLDTIYVGFLVGLWAVCALLLGRFSRLPPDSPA